MDSKIQTFTLYYFTVIEEAKKNKNKLVPEIHL